MHTFRTKHSASAGFNYRRRLALSLLALPLSLSLLNVTPSYAALESDDVGMYGSVTVQREASAAATAMKKADWIVAQNGYKKLIGMASDQEDFYFGLYQASHKLQQWDQVALALEQLFQLRPRYKEQMCLEYGECLYYLNRYDEAEPMLKRALVTIAQPSIVEQRLNRLMEKSIIKKEAVQGPIIAYVEPKKIEPVKRIELDAKEVSEESSEKSLNLLNAFMKSETIVVAEYRGYEKSDKISYYRPPKAIFHIEENLKGAPLNPTLPVRYEFHTKLAASEKPKDWKFSDAVMPKKDSKWIIFIPNSVPNDGMFDTFHGSYGVMEYNEKNIDDLMKIIEQHKGQTK